MKKHSNKVASERSKHTPTLHEELLAFVRMCSKEFNNVRFTDRYGYGALADKLIARAEGKE